MSVMDKAGDRWPVDGLVEDKWQALRYALVESADEVDVTKVNTLIGFWNLQMLYNLF